MGGNGVVQESSQKCWPGAFLKPNKAVHAALMELYTPEEIERLTEERAHHDRYLAGVKALKEVTPASLGVAAERLSGDLGGHEYNFWVIRGAFVRVDIRGDGRLGFEQLHDAMVGIMRGYSEQEEAREQVGSRELLWSAVARLGMEHGSGFTLADFT